MVDDIAKSVRSASSRAGVGAFIPYASSVSRAIVVQNAFGPATGVRISLILRETGAFSVAGTLSVGTAWRRTARVTRFHSFGFYKIIERKRTVGEMKRD